VATANSELRLTNILQISPPPAASSVPGFIRTPGGFGVKRLRSGREKRRNPRIDREENAAKTLSFVQKEYLRERKISSQTIPLRWMWKIKFGLPKPFDSPNILSNLNVIMKLLNATLTVIALGVVTALAGPAYDKGKNPMVVDARCPCFFDGLQVGVFGTAIWGPNALGNEYINNPVAGAPAEKSDNAFGAGINLTYYVTENIALEYSYSWLNTRSDRHINALDLLYRFPLGNSCWAPYLMGGAGLNSDGTTVGVYRAGAGIEYRLANCVGIFADYSHNWVAGGDEGWGNDFNIGRAGLRIPF
jgi:hypothetical protein